MNKILIKTKIILLVCFILSLYFSACTTTQYKEKYSNKSNCGILDSIVHLTFDTIETKTMFYSYKNFIYYNNYLTDEYAPIITKGADYDTLWFVSSRKAEIPQTYSGWRKAYNFFLGWVFPISPSNELSNEVLYPKYKKKITDTNNLGEMFYSVRANPNNNKMPLEDWGKPQILKTNDDTFDNYVRGPITTINGTDFIIAADRDISQGVSKNWDLYSITKSGDKFINRKPINSINTSDYWESQPALSQDGKTLFFVSDRPNPKFPSKRSKDIWYSEMTATGEWGEPKTLDSVNTEYDEIFPHCGADGNFYFSSNRPGGQGGFDIYIIETDKTGKKFYPKNFNDLSTKKIPYPKINTKSDEISPYIIKSLNSETRCIYYSSNKSEGFGKFDLYACNIEKEKKDTVSKNPHFNLEILVSIQDMCTSIYTKQKDTAKADSVERPFVDVLIIDNATAKVVDTIRHKGIKQLKPNTSYSLIMANPRYKCEPISFTTPAYMTDSLIEVKCFLVGSHLGTIIFSDDTGIPYFITGYWRPLTTENYNAFKSEQKSQQLNGACYKENDYKDNYTKVPPIIDEYFKKNIYDEINSILPILKLKEYICKDSLVLRITIDGYTDACGIPDSCRYTGADIIVNKILVPHNKKFQGATLKDTNGGIIQLKESGQTGNVLLSMLRAYYTYETMHKHLLATSPFYKSAYESKRVEYIINGNGIYDKSEIPISANRNQPLMRRIEISLDAVTRDFEIEKQAPVRDVCSYYVELKLDNEQNALDYKQFLEKYSSGYFSGKNSLNLDIDTNKNGNYNLISNHFPSLKEALEFDKTIQKTINDARIIKKIESDIYEEHNQYSISFGTYQTEENAIKYMKKLESFLDSKLNIQVNILPNQKYSVRTKPFERIEIAQNIIDGIREKLNINRIPSFLKIIMLDSLYEGAGYCSDKSQIPNVEDKSKKSEKIVPSSEGLVIENKQNIIKQESLFNNDNFSIFIGCWEGTYTINDKTSNGETRNVNICFEKIVGNDVVGKKQIILPNGDIFKTTDFKGIFSKLNNKINLKFEELGDEQTGKAEFSFDLSNIEQGKGIWKSYDGKLVRYITILKK